MRKLVKCTCIRLNMELVQNFRMFTIETKEANIYNKNNSKCQSGMLGRLKEIYIQLLIQDN